MTDYVVVVWRIDDGYAGPDAPQRTRIRMDAFDADESDDEIAAAISESVKDDFESKISLDLRDEDLKAAVAKVRAYFTSKPRDGG